MNEWLIFLICFIIGYFCYKIIIINKFNIGGQDFVLSSDEENDSNRERLLDFFLTGFNTPLQDIDARLNTIAPHINIRVNRDGRLFELINRNNDNINILPHDVGHRDELTLHPSDQLQTGDIIEFVVPGRPIFGAMGGPSFGPTIIQFARVTIHIDNVTNAPFLNIEYIGGNNPIAMDLYERMLEYIYPGGRVDRLGRATIGGGFMPHYRYACRDRDRDRA